MSKDSSIKVFAENVGDTNPRPVNNIPVWIENVSAIGGGGGGGDIPSDVSGKWEDASDCVQTNSASWGQGGEPGNMSAKLDASAVGFYNHYGTYYVSGISGKQLSATRARTAEFCGNADVANTANYAYTATQDTNGNYLTDTYYSIQNLSSFVQNNSANWGGGSTGSSGSLLIHDYYNNYDGEHSAKFISGAVDYYFEAYVDVNAGTPSEMILFYRGGEAGRIPWVLVSSDGYQNYFTASYNNLDGNEISFGNNGFTNYNMCQVSADGVQTNPFYPDGYHCDTQTPVKFNIQGSNIVGDIWGDNGHGLMQLTSFTGGLTNFTATGYIRYGYNISPEDTANNYNYDVSAEFCNEGGSTVTSADVLPPAPTGTGNTYALYWNDANGLFWDIR